MLYHIFAKLHFVQNYLVQMIKPLFVVCYLRVYMYSFLWTFFLLFILWYYWLKVYHHNSTFNNTLALNAIREYCILKFQ